MDGETATKRRKQRKQQRQAGVVPSESWALEQRILLDAAAVVTVVEAVAEPASEAQSSEPADTSAQDELMEALEPAAVSDESKDSITANYIKTPLAFESNEGQTDAQVDYLARGSGYTVFLTDGDAVLRITDGENQYAIRLSLANANENLQSSTQSELTSTSNYFIGSDSENWQTDITQSGSVTYENVYEGIDLRYYGTSQQQLEYDFILAAGANPDDISIDFEGAVATSIDEFGNLVLSLDGQGNEIIFKAPITYQEIDGERVYIESHYTINEQGQIGFDVGEYDTSLGLVIDPILDYGSYLGGIGSDDAYDVAVDSSGNAYITGYTTSTDFPTTTGAYDEVGNANTDVFVTKLSADGSTLLYSTYLGGNATDQAYAIEVNASGEVFIAGGTYSTNFSTTTGAYQETSDGNQDAFVTKLNAAGNGLVYSTLLGGTGSEVINDIALDASGNAYVTGQTDSSNFDTTTGAYDETLGGTQDAFVTKINATGTALSYSTYLGGALNDDYAFGIAVDASGNVYVTGYTFATDFVTTGSAYDSVHSGSTDAFLTKLNTSGSGVLYSTFLGGSGVDQAYDIAIDSSGYVHITGHTGSSDFYTTPGAYDSTLNGTTDIFAASFDTSQSGSASLRYSTFIGGSGDDYGEAIAIDSNDNIWITGRTLSTDLYTSGDAHDISLGGTQDAFLLSLSSDGTAVNYSTYLGGGDVESGYGIVIDSNDNIYLVGSTQSSDFDMTAGAFDETYNAGTNDAFIVKFTEPTVFMDLDADNSTGAAGGDYNASFHSGGGSIYITGSDAFINLQSATLDSLTVTITNLLDGTNESLIADVTGTSIISAYNSTTGVLTLTGTDTVANYEQVLHSIQYDNALGSPILTERGISFVADDGVNTSNVATSNICLHQDYADNFLMLSTDITATLGGLSFAHGEIAGYDSGPDTASLILDDVAFTTDEDINAFHLLENGNYLISTKDAAVIGGLSFGPGQLAEYNPLTDTATLYLDVPGFSSTANISGVSLLDNGNLIISVLANSTLGGISFNKGDLVEYNIATDTGTLFFSRALFTGAETIDAVHILDNGNIVLSTTTSATLGGLSFGANDLVEYNIGTDTATLYFDSSLYTAAGNTDAAFVNEHSNLEPRISNATFSLAENTANLSVVGTVTGIDPDAGDALTYAITAGNTGSTFAINSSTGEITVSDNTVLDFETNPTFNLTVQVTDNAGLNDTATITINLTNVNETPTINNATFGLAENTANLAVVGTVTATDPDASETLSYSITAGNTGSAFSINSSTGQITVNDSSVLDFETNPTFNLTVEVSDAGLLTDTATITINLSNVNETPTINNATFNIAENLANLAVVGTVTATDPDASETLTYSITAGNTGSAFAINSSTGQITVNDTSAVDFETTPTFNLTIEVSDAGLLTDTATITINLSDVNDSPIINNQSLSIAENSANLSVVGTVTATDQDAGDTLTYTITAGNTGSAFSINSSTGQITVNDSSVLDLETNPTFNLTVEVTDAALLTDTATITINLSNVNETPTINNATFGLVENTSNASVVGTVTATVPHWEV